MRFFECSTVSEGVKASNLRLRRAKASCCASRRTLRQRGICTHLQASVCRKSSLPEMNFCRKGSSSFSASTATKKCAPTLWVRIFLLWRRRRDSNPCGLAPKRFSRPPRYDHFDTPPYAAIIVECSCIVNGGNGQMKRKHTRAGA